MRQSVLFLIFCVVWVWSKPNFDRFAQIFGREININEEGVSGYVDSEGKLWVLATKWHTKKIAVGGGGSPAILPDGRIVQPPPTKYGEMRTYPYLYFWLYDKEGNKINEGALGDSIQGASLVYFENGDALIIARVETDIGRRMADPPRGYYVGYLVDNKGTVKDRKRIINGNPYISEIIPIGKGDKILLTMINKDSTFVLDVKGDRINVFEGPELPRLTPDRRAYRINIGIDTTLFFGWTQVNSATQFRYNPILKTTTWEDIILFKDKIQVAKFDLKTNEWDVKRYELGVACSREYNNFALFPLSSIPAIKNIPEVQCVRLMSGSIVVTVFLQENNKPTAYQLFFDSLGDYIKPAKKEFLSPMDISLIPDGSKIYIRRHPAERTKSGKYKGAYVYIWGYGLDDGMLYWRKYHID